VKYNKLGGYGDKDFSLEDLLTMSGDAKSEMEEEIKIIRHKYDSRLERLGKKIDLKKQILELKGEFDAKEIDPKNYGYLDGLEDDYIDGESDEPGNLVNDQPRRGPYIDRAQGHTHPEEFYRTSYTGVQAVADDEYDQAGGIFLFGFTKIMLSREDRWCLCAGWLYFDFN
jgi:hypothetical protein